MNNKLNKYIISPDVSIREAYDKMIRNKKKIIFVCKNNFVFIGLLTAGDFHRALWSNIDLDYSVSSILKKKFIYIKSKKDILNFKKIPKDISHIPIIKKKKLIDVLFDVNYVKKKENLLKKNIKFSAFILAGGYGKRLRPITKKIPKALVPINNEPIISIIVKKFSKFNLNRIYLSLFYKKKLIKKFIKDDLFLFKDKIKFIEENLSTGTAGSLSKIDKNISTPVIVTNCDTILKYNYNEILKYHLKKKADVTIVGFLHESILRYGVCNVSPRGDLVSVEEKPKTKNLVNCGFYVFNPLIFKKIQKNKYLDMISFLKKVIKDNKKISFYPVAHSNFLDIGTIEEYKKINKNYNN